VGITATTIFLDRCLPAAPAVLLWFREIPGSFRKVGEGRIVAANASRIRTIQKGESGIGAYAE
jgi:hypothetical protein